MRWDWQIGRVTPLQRTGERAVDIYDIDGFLTTRAEVQRIHTAWQASTLPHPKAVCYLDLAWEDYRPDASPAPYGRSFPAAALGKVYYGYPEERWVDFRQLDELKPMLNERIAMCARKGFDAVELDDIDSFDPPSTTGFHLTPGDAQNYLAYAFNQVHRDGMTALWKNSPLLAWWGVRYTDGAVVEECYTYGGCFASPQRGNRQYGITCSGLPGRRRADGTSSPPTARPTSRPASGSARPSTAPTTSCATRGRPARHKRHVRHLLPPRVRAARRLRRGQVRRQPRRQGLRAVPHRGLAAGQLPLGYLRRRYLSRRETAHAAGGGAPVRRRPGPPG